MRVGHALAPQRWGKDDDGKQKEDAGYFEPKDAAHPAKGPEEAPDALTYAAARPGRRLPGCPHCRASLRSRIRGCLGRCIGRIGRARGKCAADWLRLRRQALAGQTPGNTQSNAQSAPDAS